jgi:transposase
MERLLERCCGLDVHKASVTACARLPDRGGERVELVQEFPTMTADLLALRDWLEGLGVTHVAMEATGVYWKPVWYVLEGGFELVLCNAAQVKHVPGRKTDVGDAQWLCRLLEVGLLRASFVPPKPIRELRDLTRYRKTLIRERSREVNRLHKLLEDAGIKLACVASDVLGVSGRAMIEALITGGGDPARLAELAKGRLRAKLPALRRALEGRFNAHHALLAGELLAHLDYLDESIERLSDEITVRLRPFEQQVELLCTIPGVQRRCAEVILAELGPDMSRFPSHRHAASWTHLSPGNDQSAGKRRPGHTRQGKAWLRENLIEAALAASRTRDSYLRAQYDRLRSRRGHKRAVVAVAHSIIVAAYYMLRDNVPYDDLGGDYFLRRERPERRTRRLTQQLEQLGHRVTLEPIAARPPQIF